VSEILINVDVDDLERGIAFFVRGLGLKVGRRFGAQGVEMLGGSSPIYLLLKREGSHPFPGATSRRDFGRHWTPVHLDLAVENLEAAVDQAVAAGAKLEGGIAEQAWGRLARMADPFGNGFCFLQFKGKGYDEIAEGAG